VAINGYGRRLDAISRKLTPHPDEPMTLEMTLQTIEELEANPQRTFLLGMPIEVCMSLVVAETARLEALLGE